MPDETVGDMSCNIQLLVALPNPSKRDDQHRLGIFTRQEYLAANCDGELK